jgi:membrane protein
MALFRRKRAHRAHDDGHDDAGSGVHDHVHDGVHDHGHDDTGNGVHDDGRGRAAQRPSDIPAAGWKDVLLRVKTEFKDDHTTLAAAGVAFYGFLAAIPALAALVSVYGLFASPEQIQERVDDLFGGLPEDARALLTDQLTSIVDQSSQSLSWSLAISLALSLWSASSGMGHLVEAVNVAYDEKETRGFVRLKALALALTLGALVVVALMLGAMTALPALLNATDLPDPARLLINLAVWPVMAAVLVVALAVLYRRGPDRDDPRWRWLTWGSVVAVVVWVAASIGFQFYSSNFGSYNETYGSLAAVVLLLLWLFLSAFAVLLGAQINSEIEHQTAVDSTRGAAEPLGQRGAVMADTVGERMGEDR